MYWVYRQQAWINLNFKRVFGFLESDKFAREDPNINQYDDRIKPHEQRVLNFLVNEYLMQHNYKLTSITFADENENQVNNFFFCEIYFMKYLYYLIANGWVFVLTCMMYGQVINTSFINCITTKVVIFLVYNFAIKN